jgi:hypothetical protein
MSCIRIDLEMWCGGMGGLLGLGGLFIKKVELAGKFRSIVVKSV